MISIIVASKLNIVFLKRLFQSLEMQSFKKMEVLLCATNPSAQEQKDVFSISKNLNVKVVKTNAASIARARNKGLSYAKGRIAFFLDEDCFLPHKNYLQEMFTFHTQNPSFAAGGLYLSENLSSSGDQFYNFVCNAWVVSHQNLKRSPPVLLGGCCFYPLKELKKYKIFFDEKNSRAGEEYLLNSLWTQQGLPLLLSHRWSVFHSPQTTYSQVLRKSWIQGAQIKPKNGVFPLQQLSNSLSFLKKEKKLNLKHLSMLGIYGAVGRISLLRTLLSQKQIHNRALPHNIHEWQSSLLSPANTAFSLTTAKNKKRKQTDTIPPIRQIDSSTLKSSAKKMEKTKAAKAHYTN